MVPVGAVPNQTIPVILDGAKRDRRPWIGDLLVQGRTAFSSLGFGAKGSDYIKSTIAAFGATQAADGSIFGHIGNWTVWPPTGGFYSTSYSTYYVLDLASYYLYSGDAPFAESQYQTMKNELAYNRALVDPSSGLLVTRAAAGRDWDFYDGDKLGAVTAYNAIYYKALTDAARVASDLAGRDPSNPSAATWQSDAATWSSQATDLRQRINAVAVRRRAWRLQAGRPGQRDARRDRGAAGRQLRGHHLRSRAGRDARRHPALPQGQPLGQVRAAAVLARTPTTRRSSARSSPAWRSMPGSPPGTPTAPWR